MSITLTRQTIIDELNNNKDLDLLDFNQCKKFYDELLLKKATILEELKLNNEQSEITGVVKKSEKLEETCDNLLERSQDVVVECEENLAEVSKLRREIQEQFDKLHALQCTLQYLKVVQQIEFLSTELERGYKKKDDEFCATIFANLCEISRNLTNFSGNHLRQHLKLTLHYWHDILKKKFSKDFNDILDIIKWPFTNANFSLQQPNPNDIHKLQIVCEYLLQIELPSEVLDPSITSGLLSDFPPLCLPISLLITPLRKRFLYHFYGTRQTNRPDKPEWYFTQVLTWIRDHIDFVIKWIQPVIDKIGLLHIDAKLEFIRGLVQLTVEKLNSELPQIQFDDFTFSHSIDEALGFNKELRETYEYPPTQPSILAVLTQPKILMKWMAMEKKFATEKMDAMLSTSVEPFEPLNVEDEYKITVCADAFIILLQTITERYECLPQPGHRLQFLELQLELLDDFRVRLLQIINAEQDNIVESRVPLIVNTIYYIENVLIDWGAMLHYLNLYYYKTQLNNAELGVNNKSLLSSGDFLDVDEKCLEVETDSVFGEILGLYRRLRCDLLGHLSDFILIEVKSLSKPYRRENWNSMKATQNFNSLSLTPSACPMLEVIAKRLHQLQKNLTPKLFNMIWRSLAQRIDDYFLENLVLDNRFSDGGAQQLKYDITRNLCPLFSQFSEKPDNYFTQLIESCILLNLAKGTALLLRETLLALEGAEGVEDTRRVTLKEIKVNFFTPKMAVKVLNQRVDITIKRAEFD